MALPNSEHFSRGAEFQPASPPIQPQLKATYAQVLTSKHKVSLMHEDVRATHTDSDTPITEIHSRVYRASRRPDALLLDISRIGKQYSDIQCIQELGKQHPGVHACSVISDNQLRYLEAYITKAKDDNDIVTNGVLFEKVKIKVYPCSATDLEMTYTDLKLTNLPPLARHEVLEGLKQSLAPFGQVVDVGINAEPMT
ncbi:hypothetical protein A0J61_09217, partial [Choanephora cucurbitarum]